MERTFMEPIETSDATRMERVVHSPGPWSHSNQQGHSHNCLQAQVWDSNGSNLAVVEASDNAAIATGNAVLLAASPSMKEFIERLYDGIHCGTGPLAGSTDSELGDHIHDTMFDLFGVRWHSVV